MQSLVLPRAALQAALVMAALVAALLLPSTASATAPSATTGSATNITATSAVLNGVVNANDKVTSWHFDYASNDEFEVSGTYPHSTPGGVLQICVGTCVPILHQDAGVSERVENLASNTTYHFRVVASNADGTTYGQDVTFKTLKK